MCWLPSHVAKRVAPSEVNDIKQRSSQELVAVEHRIVGIYEQDGGDMSAFTPVCSADRGKRWRACLGYGGIDIGPTTEPADCIEGLVVLFP